jgi:hypothetical protein
MNLVILSALLQAFLSCTSSGICATKLAQTLRFWVSNFRGVSEIARGVSTVHVAQCISYLSLYLIIDQCRILFVMELCPETIQVRVLYSVSFIADQPLTRPGTCTKFCTHSRRPFHLFIQIQKQETGRKSRKQGVRPKIMAEICMSCSKRLGCCGLNAIEFKPGCLSPVYVKVPLAKSDEVHEKHSTQLQSTSSLPKPSILHKRRGSHRTWNTQPSNPGLTPLATD